MNERIKELYGNALDKAVPYTWHNLDHVEVEKIMKVFAELIVLEFVDLADANMNDILDQPVFNPTDEIWNRARVVELTRFTLRIKKHFGVEE